MPGVTLPRYLRAKIKGNIRHLLVHLVFEHFRQLFLVLKISARQYILLSWQTNASVRLFLNQYERYVMATARALVTWRSEYNLGVEEIDNQHRSLVDLVNQVWESIVFQAEWSKVLELVLRLEQYTVAHFAAEEAYMQAIAYPDLEAHKKIHQQFIARIDAEKQAALKNGRLTLGLVEFLRQWLLDHILGHDKEATEFAKKAQLTRAKEQIGSSSQGEEPESLLKSIFKRFF